jgi:hypothetical protein
MIEGAFASRTLIAQFPDGNKEEMHFAIGPVLNNEKMFNYLCGVSCSNQMFKKSYIAGVDQIDAIFNAVRFMEDMIQNNSLGIDFFWADSSVYHHLGDQS